MTANDCLRSTNLAFKFLFFPRTAQEVHQHKLPTDSLTSGRHPQHSGLVSGRDPADPFGVTKEILLSLEALLTVSVLIETSFGTGLKLSLNEVAVIRRKLVHAPSTISIVTGRTVTDAIWTPLHPTFLLFFPPELTAVQTRQTRSSDDMLS